MKIALVGRDRKVYITGEEKLKNNNIILEEEVNDGVLFVQDTNIEGLFNYGYRQTCADYMGHGPGYIWASRASVMNKTFGMTLMDIYYKKENDISYSSCAIDLYVLEPLLKDTEFEIDWNPQIDDEDAIYMLKKKGVN